MPTGMIAVAGMARPELQRRIEQAGTSGLKVPIVIPIVIPMIVAHEVADDHAVQARDGLLTESRREPIPEERQEIVETGGT